MGKYFNSVSLFISSFGGGIAYLLGGWDALAKSLLILMCIDYLSGVLKALYSKNLSSQIGLKGIIRKVFILLIVCCSAVAERVLGVQMAREMIVCFFIANEMLSIIENGVEIGAPVPEWLKQALLQIRNKK